MYSGLGSDSEANDCSLQLYIYIFKQYPLSRDHAMQQAEFWRMFVKVAVSLLPLAKQMSGSDGTDNQHHLFEGRWGKVCLNSVPLKLVIKAWWQSSFYAHQNSVTIRGCSPACGVLYTFSLLVYASRKLLKCGNLYTLFDSFLFCLKLQLCPEPLN